MITAADIQQWLTDGCEYNRGVEIYTEINGAGIWQNKWPDYIAMPVRHDNLIYELEKAKKQLSLSEVRTIQAETVLVIQEQSLSVRAESRTDQNAITNNETAVNSSGVENKAISKEEEKFLSLPTEIQEMEKRRKELFRDASKRRADLFSDDIEKVKAAAEFIVPAMRENRRIWEELDYFNTHGVRMPRKQVVLQADIENLNMAQLGAFAKNLASWCTKEKKKIEQEMNAEKKKYRQENLAQKTKELELAREVLREYANQ